jgi:TRAP-type C4-dicarboxylate transport system substrate-binding protein
MMNLKTWNSLPADIQQIIEDLSGKERSRIAAAAFEKGEAFLKGMITGIDKKAGKPGPYTLTKEERARWLETVRPIWYKWAEEKDAKGLPGTKVLEDALRLIEKYSKKGS